MAPIEILGRFLEPLGEDHLLAGHKLVVADALPAYDQLAARLLVVQDVVPSDRRVTAHLAGAAFLLVDADAPEVLPTAPEVGSGLRLRVGVWGSNVNCSSMVLRINE
jgi:hypothetical protein